MPGLGTADYYIASVVDRHRVAVGAKSAAYLAALEVMPLVKEWAGNYLRGITPSGAYAKGTAVSLCTDIDLLIALKPIPGMEMRNAYWSLFEFLAGRSFQPEVHSVAMQVRHKGVKVDLIPACVVDSNPHRHMLFHKDSTPEIRTDVAEHVRLVCNSGHTREICALKVWRERNRLEFPSLYLELVVLEALADCRCGKLAEKVLTVLRFIAERVRKLTVPDPANEENIVSDGLTTNEKQWLAKAASRALFEEDWKQILW